MKVEHEEQRNRFVINLDGEDATLNYQLIGDVMNIMYTAVPEASEGEGVGSDLVRAAMDWARESGKRVETSCRFARTWLERHTEYQDVLSTI
jgi:predicted GNAT family acetyltransferase